MPQTLLMLLLRFPEDIVTGVLSGWLDTKSCVRLDSAFCNRSSRNNLLDLYQRRLIVQNAPSTGQTQAFLNWLCLRSVCTAELVIHNCREKHPGDDEYLPFLELCSKYLSYGGRTVIKLDVRKCSSLILDLIAIHCNNMSRVKMDECDASTSLLAILTGNSRLSELCLDACCFATDTISINSSFELHSLQKLCIENTHGRICDDALVVLAKTFPNLRAMHMWSNRTTGETFTTILKVCPQIVNISMHECSSENSTVALIAILDNVKLGLLALDLSSFELTEETVQKIIFNHAASLLHLKVDIVTSGALYLRLLNACTELQTLDISDSDEEELPSVLPFLRLPKLQTLMCDTYDELLMGCIATLTKFSPEFTTLCLYGRSDPYLDNIIQKLGTTHTALRKVTLNGSRTKLRYVKVSGGSGGFRKEETEEGPPVFDVLSFPAHR